MPSSRSHGSGVRGAPLDKAENERRLLRALCAARLSPSQWREIHRALDGYCWSEIERGLVYDAIRRVSSRTSQSLREELPAEATRLGFPDIDWRIYFNATGAQATAPDFARIAALIGELPNSEPGP